MKADKLRPGMMFCIPCNITIFIIAVAIDDRTDNVRITSVYTNYSKYSITCRTFRRHEDIYVSWTSVG